MMNVAGPGGIVVAFPDGTDAATIDSVMRQATGGDAPATKGDRLPMAPGAVAHPQPGPPTPAAQVNAPPPDAGIGDAIIRHVYQGATFGFGDELAAGVGTLLGRPYDQTLADARAGDAAAAANHPYVSAASQIAGAIPTALLAPEMNLIRAPAAAGAGASLATRALTSLGRGAANIGNAAINGAAYAGLAGYGAGEGGVDNRLASAGQSAALGGAIGAAAPVVGAGVRAAGGALGHPVDALKALFNPEQRAAQGVVDAAVRDTGSVGAATQALQDMGQGGAPVAPIDLGETSRALGRQAANLNPEARATLNQGLDARAATQFDRVSQVLDDAMPGANAPATRDLLQAAAARANKPAYDAAYLQGAGGVWHEGLQQLTAAPDMQAAIKAATATGANKAAVEGFRPPQNPFQPAGDGTLVLKPGVKPTLQFWDNVKQNLDDMISRSQRTGDNGQARDLTRIKSQLVSYLDEAVPSYKAARQGAAAFFGADDALTAGQQFANMKVTAQSLADAQKAAAKFSPAERKLFAEGYATEVKTRLANVPDRANIVNRIFQSPVARQQFEIALGPQAARDMEAALRVESIMDLGRKAVQGNSTTARQLIESGLAGMGVGVATSGADPFNPMTWLNPRTIITAALSGVAIRGGRAGINSINAEVAKHVAKMLVSRDPQIVRKAYAMIGRNPAMMGALRRGHDRIAKLFAPVIGRGVGGQGAAAARMPMPSIASGVQPAEANQNGQQ